MISLPVKYRPETFEDVVGQSTTVKILKQQIATNNIRNAYSFIGESGSGKTTVARIFTKAIDGEPYEIDAASNNGVDNIRAIIENAQERSLSNKYKVYILDEVHMLSNSAFASLLKILEEPPQHSVFILCTTDPQKIPDTILNRTQKYTFNKLTFEDIYNRLSYICNKEGFSYEKEALNNISIIANGSMREAISLLGQVADFNNNITLKSTLDIIGISPYETYFELINYLLDGKEKDVLNVVEKVSSQGKDLKLFVDNFLTFNLDVIKYILFNNIINTSIPSYMEEDLKKIINFESPQNYYNYVIDKLLSLKEQLKDEANAKTLIEIYLIKIARCM